MIGLLIEREKETNNERDKHKRWERSNIDSEISKRLYYNVVGDDEVMMEENED